MSIRGKVRARLDDQPTFGAVRADSTLLLVPRHEGVGVAVPEAVLGLEVLDDLHVLADGSRVDHLEPVLDALPVSLLDGREVRRRSLGRPTALVRHGP